MADINLSDILTGLGIGGVSALLGGNNSGQLAVLAALASILQNQADKSGMTYGNAQDIFNTQQAGYQNRMDSAALPQNTIDQMRGAVTDRAYQSPLSPTVTASTQTPGVIPTPNVPAKQDLTALLNSMPNKTPAPSVPGTIQPPTPTVQAPTSKPEIFNPYKTGQMGNTIAPEILNQVMKIAMGGMNPNVQWGNDILMNQLALRSGQRDMRVGDQSGTLNPLTLPSGTNPLYKLR